MSKQAEDRVSNLQRVLNVAAAIRTRVRAAGGLRSMGRRALARYREDGWSGFYDRVQHLLRTIRGAAGYSYDSWIRKFDTLDDAARGRIRARIEAFAHRPLISIVVPTFNPRAEWLEAAVDSVRTQLYPHWELCIADDVSTDPTVRLLLERLAREDARIKLVFREQNGHISAASNSALTLATGEWVALLDHDDLLSEHALFWIADAINADPAARMIYSDEDKLDEAHRFDPYFKCDWNLDLFYSRNIFSHLGVYRRDLIEEVGGFRIGFEGSQDYDLALRCIEQIAPTAVHHVPRVLYHWRIHPESTATAADAKPYAAVAGERALNEHFQRIGVRAAATWQRNGYRVRYALPDPAPLVSIIIPTRNGLELIRQCIDSILQRSSYKNFEILIVDNGSDDAAALNYFESLRKDARIRVLRDDRPFNYSALNNEAVAQARGEYIALVNNDIEVISPDWIEEMLGFASQPGVGAVGAKLLYPDGTIQHAGVVMGMGGIAGHVYKHAPRAAYGYFGRACLSSRYAAVTAACLVVSRARYLEVGGLNEPDLAVAFNDIDFCLKLDEAGYRNVYTPYAELYHHESATRGSDLDPNKLARFIEEQKYMATRWRPWLSADRFYSPNLSLDRDDSSYAWPPRVESL
jgi:O-antigen biosynthesis protein